MPAGQLPGLGTRGMMLEHHPGERGRGGEGEGERGEGERGRVDEEGGRGRRKKVKLV